MKEFKESLDKLIKTYKHRIQQLEETISIQDKIIKTQEETIQILNKNQK